MMFISGVIVGIALGYGFRGFARRHMSELKAEALRDIQKAHDKITLILPYLEDAVKGDVEKAIAALKKVL